MSRKFGCWLWHPVLFTLIFYTYKLVSNAVKFRFTILTNKRISLFNFFLLHQAIINMWVISKIFAGNISQRLTIYTTTHVFYIYVRMYLCTDMYGKYSYSSPNWSMNFRFAPFHSAESIKSLNKHLPFLPFCTRKRGLRNSPKLI